MSRKSKAKFEMKGHSIPGVKGFKSTSLEDGRAASSAFQMKESPLHTEAEKLEFAKAELGEEESFKRHRSKKPEETGVEYGMRGAMELALALREKGKEEEEDVITKQKEKYEGDEGTYEEYLADMEAKGVEPMSLGAWAELNLQNVDPDIEGEREDAVETYVPPVVKEEGWVDPRKEEIKDTTPDFSTFASVNDLVAERKLWEEENPGVRFPGQDEINKRLKENPNKWD